MAGVVTVGCKMPTGIILRIHQPYNETELVMGGGTRDVTVYRALETTHTVWGPRNAKLRDPVDANDDPILVTLGYALTPGIPADFWDVWVEQNKNSMLFKNKLVFAAARQMDVRSMVKENKDVRSGMEPLNPDNDPRVNKDPTRLPNGREVNSFGTADVPAE